MFLFQDDPAAQQQAESVAAKASQEVNDALQGLRDGDFQKVWPLLQGYVVPAIEVLLLLIVAYMAARGITVQAARERLCTTRSCSVC